MNKYCVVVPHYNHVHQFEHFLPKIMAEGLSCIIADDASTADQQKKLREIVAPYENVHLVVNEENQGKGGATKNAILKAESLGFSHCIQIDADGQHNAGDLLRFVQESEKNPGTMICGKPVFDDSIPKVRLHGRKITLYIVVLETLSLSIKDGLCGYRVYPVAQFKELLARYSIGNRMDFDTEVLVKALWCGMQLKFIDTRVNYPEHSVSHFRYLEDNLRLIALHTRLIIGMICRLPMLILRKFL